jgi:N-methylhydantoinase B/oxoprolinase/acetone carboxylase alpha subunit
MTTTFQVKTQTTATTMADELRHMFDELGINNFSEEMKEYIISELGEQVIERVMIKMVKDLPESKVTAFLEFIEKGASQESLYIYLTSIYPEAEEIITETAREIMDEFKEGMQG